MSESDSYFNEWKSTRQNSNRPTGDAIGESDSYVQFQSQLSRVAKVNRPVLIVGERGSGKELAIKRLHFLSQRWQSPLIALNCAALSPGVLESELFGHESGAFTGAQRQRRGRFETANAGTLFLDEIGLIPMNVQEKILRVVEYGEFERVGGSESIQVDVRIVGATNADLKALSDENKFKADLLDRLSFEVLFIPPLRERKEDILLLARHFASHMASELGRREVIEFSPSAEKALEEYPWPGNIRELKNVVERALYRSEKPIIESISFDPFQCPWNPEPEGKNSSDTDSDNLPSQRYNPNQNLSEQVRSLEFEAITSALNNNQHHQAKAADALGLSYHQFRGLLRKYRNELSD
jgi:psp operon transcriptional activator